MKLLSVTCTTIFGLKLGFLARFISNIRLKTIKKLLCNNNINSFIIFQGAKSYALMDSTGREDVKFKGVQGGITYELMRSLLSGIIIMKHFDVK